MKHFKVMNFFIIVNNESFVFCATRMFAIYLLRFQHHHLDLDTFLNKIFELNIM
jgi:hypothetical protein